MPSSGLCKLATLCAVWTAVVTAERLTRHRLAHIDDVVDLPLSRSVEPRCTYAVRHQSPHGPAVTSHVAIGETLYHNWECAYLNRNQRGGAYCILVHNCTVSPMTGGEAPQIAPFNHRLVEMIDEFGCSRHPQILPDVRYSSDLTAYVESQAFALDFDQPAIAFKCNIRMLLKAEGVCRRPRCA